jgi:hypothetical protein
MKTQDPMRFWAGVLGAAVFGLALAVAAVQAQPAQPQTAPRPPSAAASKSLTEAERKLVDELGAEQKQLDTDGARVMAASPDGRRRVAETIGKQFGVPEKVVNDVRARKLSYSDVTIALALSQQLTKREKGLTRPQAIDRIVTLRKSGQSWGVAARDLGLRLGDVIGEVKKTDKQLAKLDAVRIARAEKQARPEKAVTTAISRRPAAGSPPR